MNQSNQSKQVLLSVIGVAILVVAVVGVSFAFFSYTNTGSNTGSVETGQIVFTASNSGTMQLTNQFPIASTDVNATNKVTVSAGGKTTYAEGIDFVVLASDVQGTTSITSGSDTFTITPTVTVTVPTAAQSISGVTITPAAANVDLTSVGSGTTTLARGHIDANAALGTVSEAYAVTASVPIVEIVAYYDMSKYHISDNTKAELVAAGLLDSSYNGQIIPTAVWNQLANASPAAYSFKVTVNATQGNSGRLAS